MIEAPWECNHQHFGNSSSLLKLSTCQYFPQQSLAGNNLSVFLSATDSLLNPPASRLRTKEALRHPPGRTQGSGQGRRGSKGERRGRIAGREGRQQPEFHATRDPESQQAPLSEWRPSVHAEAQAGECTQTQVGQRNPHRIHYASVYGSKEKTHT